ncbi:hypothetical protein FGO68_gene7020 [Halteria grandinella]|uniref:Uncharacterized protein n=1 Tax=Halteria grandinella TaxID=5974 RepID=A0A8J8P0W6_HALGN|nr:hypothetical protein FGO68_gene7020 [Halteria grandinella]
MVAAPHPQWITVVSHQMFYQSNLVASLACYFLLLITQPDLLIQSEKYLLQNRGCEWLQTRRNFCQGARFGPQGCSLFCINFRFSDGCQLLKVSYLFQAITIYGCWSLQVYSVCLMRYQTQQQARIISYQANLVGGQQLVASSSRSL